MSYVSFATRESSAAAAHASYLVGQDQEGHWLAVEEHGRGGGVFVSKAAALSFVRFETGRDPAACHMASGPVGLSFTPSAASGGAARPGS